MTRSLLEVFIVLLLALAASGQELSFDLAVGHYDEGMLYTPKLDITTGPIMSSVWYTDGLYQELGASVDATKWFWNDQAYVYGSFSTYADSIGRENEAGAGGAVDWAGLSFSGYLGRTLTYDPGRSWFVSVGRDFTRGRYTLTPSWDYGQTRFLSGHTLGLQLSIEVSYNVTVTPYVWRSVLQVEYEYYYVEE